MYLNPMIYLKLLQNSIYILSYSYSFLLIMKSAEK